MAPPDFSRETRDLLAFRSSLICNNPQCGTLTVGPSDAQGPLTLKLGEAAHVRGARSDGARYDPNMSDKERASFDNGIWLCANCHTMIDKNKGADFSVALLMDWKTSHEGVIRSLLYSHRSPLPLLRKFTQEGKLAQCIIDLLEDRGALFVAMDYEVPSHVVPSIESLRTALNKLSRKIKYDVQLKELTKDLISECRTFMNMTSNYPNNVPDELRTLRNRIGIYAKQLRDDYGCNIRGDLNRIVPS